MDFVPTTSGAWSALIASTALVLTQLPPIPQMLRGTKVKVELSKEIAFDNDLGNVEADFVLDVTNIGGRSVRIGSIELVLIKSTGERYSFPVEEYFKRELGGYGKTSWSNFPLTHVELKPGDRWSESVRAMKPPDEFEEEASAQIRDRVEASLASGKFQEKSERGASLDNIVPVGSDEEMRNVADPAVVKDALAFFDSHFHLTQGSYAVAIVLKTDDGVTLTQKILYQLVLYKRQIDMMRALTQDYKYGYGITSEEKKQSPTVRLERAVSEK